MSRYAASTPPWVTPLSWSEAQPLSSLPYVYDATALLLDAGQSLVAASAKAMPSGAGELNLLSLARSGSVLTLVCTGGVYGRTYTVEFTLSTSTQTFVVPVLLPMAAPIPPVTPPLPPSVGYGASVEA